MAIWINTKTKTKIDTESKLAGNWVEASEQKTNLITPKSPKQEADVPKKQAPAKLPFGKTGDDEFDSITVNEIKQELDAQGIKYNPKAKKQELYDLMMGE